MDPNLPLVPFGKYKGQPITNLLNDTKYLEWCKQQEWFQKFPIVYNICVNQTITTNNQNSKTPEHNKLQNMFLDKTNQIRLLNLLLGDNVGIKFKKNFKMLIMDEEFNNYFDSSTIKYWDETLNETLNENLNKCIWFVPEFNRSLNGSKIVFEDKYNWDFILYYNDSQYITFETKSDIENLITFETKYDIEKLTIEYLYNILNKYNFHHNRFETVHVLDTYIENKVNGKYCVDITAVCMNRIVCCELKPILSDDYPYVLRKLNTQINLTNNDKTFWQDKIFILIIGKFISSTTSKDQLILIFKQSNIQVIFTDEIFEMSTLEYIDTNTELSVNNLAEENINLQHKLFEAEEKIKLLENEIKTLQKQQQNQTKTIKDYFGKRS